MMASSGPVSEEGCTPFDLKFTKMHGLGNDFIVVDATSQPFPWYSRHYLSKLARKLCHRRCSLGADGLMVVSLPNESCAPARLLGSPGGGTKKDNQAHGSRLAPNATDCDVVFSMVNADGSFCEMCGNGIRCFAQYVVEHQILARSTAVESKQAIGSRKRKHSEEAQQSSPSTDVTLKVHTPAGLIVPTVLSSSNGKSVRVNMGQPLFAPTAIPVNLDELKKYNGPGSTTEPGSSGDAVLLKHYRTGAHDVVLSAVRMGVPHVVILVPDITAANVTELGPVLERNTTLFPEKANIGFMQVVDNRTFHYRVWERGAGETLACGTGCCAAAVIGVQLGKLSAAADIKAIVGGGEMTVLVESSSRDSTVWMTGPAVTVCEGSIPFAHLQDTLPPPPNASPLSFC